MQMKKKAYAHSVKQKFLKNLMRPWHKRNSKLLHIGSHSSLDPEFFWDMGFDVTYFTDSQTELTKIQEKNGKKIEYYLGKLDHLPFEEKTFDFVFLAHAFAQNSYTKEDKEQILHEVIRVGAQSLCLVEFNRLTLSPLEPAISSFNFKKWIDYLPEDAECEFFSALHLPSIFWTSKLPLKTLQSSPLKCPAGAIMALRINLSTIPMTSLPLKVVQSAPDLSA